MQSPEAKNLAMKRIKARRLSLEALTREPRWMQQLPTILRHPAQVGERKEGFGSSNWILIRLILRVP